MVFGYYVSTQPMPKADTVPCSANCAYIFVQMNGLVPDIASPVDVIASVMIIAPNGMILSPGSSGSTGSKTFIYPLNVFDSSFVPGTAKIGPFNPGSGYRVIIGDLNNKQGSWYALVDPSTANQSVDLLANQTTTVTYNLTLAGGGQLLTAVTYTGDKYRSTLQKFADTVLTCGSQVLTGTINYSTNQSASALNGTVFTPPPGTCSIEIKNYDSMRYRLYGDNPSKVLITNRDAYKNFNFEVIPEAPPASVPSPIGQGGGAISITNSHPPSLSPVDSPKISPTPPSKPKASPSSKARPTVSASPKASSTALTASPIASTSPIISTVTGHSPLITPPVKTKTQTAFFGQQQTRVIGVGLLLTLIASLVGWLAVMRKRARAHLDASNAEQSAPPPVN